LNKKKLKNNKIMKKEEKLRLKSLKLMLIAWREMKEWKKPKKDKA